MADAVSRVAALYNRLGLATPPEIINANAADAQAAQAALKRRDIPDLIRAILGLKIKGTPSFLNMQAEDSPARDIRPEDTEASLLAGVIARLTFESKARIGDTVALALVTASFGGLRKPKLEDDLLAAADEALTNAQSKSVSVPQDRKYSRAPTEALEALRGNNGTPQYSPAHPLVMNAIEAGQKYAELNAQAAARSDNDILQYVRQVHDELRIYWWVTAGWSSEKNCPFEKLSPTDAGIRAGKELADQDPSPYGLFAAPALLDLVVRKGRTGKVKKVSLAEAAVEPERNWRKTNFAALSSGALADLVPVSAALGLAASSEDEDDWQPRFRRLSSIDPTANRLNAVDLGLQLYREQLLLSSLAE